MSIDTPTPRRLAKIWDEEVESYGPNVEWRAVAVRIYRESEELERELSAANAERDEARAIIEKACRAMGESTVIAKSLDDYVDRLFRSFTEANAEVARLKREKDTLWDQRERLKRELQLFARAVLIFHSGGVWDDNKVFDWTVITREILGPSDAPFECTSRVLCDMARKLLVNENQ